MNQPKPLQIRLPFSVPRPKKGQEPKARICGMFKHNQCSEPFYRETLLESISADPAAGLEEKKGMMEMLRRFEEEQGGGEELLAQLEEEDAVEEDELASKLLGVNLDSNALFHLLPRDHREKFIAALKAPNSDEAKRLLGLANQENDDDDDDGFMPEELPWWEAPDVLDDENEDEVTLSYAPQPRLPARDALAEIKPAGGVGSKLAYNAIAICVAYLHILLSSRLPSTGKLYLSSRNLSPADLKSDFNSLIPFLADQKSTVRCASVRESYSAIWEFIGTCSDADTPPDLLIRLLSVLPALLHPPLDTTASPKILHLLSDIYGLFSEPKVGAPGKKLAFYVVALGQLGRAEWLGLEREVQGEIRRLEGEMGDVNGEETREERKELLL